MNARPWSATSKSLVHGLFHRLGFDVSRYPPPPRRSIARRDWLAEHQISVVLDVGANVGQYARELRVGGYRGRIVSFEPQEREYEQLHRRAADDPSWECRRLAFGDRDGTARIQVAGNSESSSLLTMSARHVEANPSSRTIGVQEVPVARLDTLQGELLQPTDRVWLKLDVQGYEMPVLAGALQTLKQTRVLESELSLDQLYEGQALFTPMIQHIESLGFVLIALDNGFSDLQTGRLLQVDGIFVRR